MATGRSPDRLEQQEPQMSCVLVAPREGTLNEEELYVAAFVRPSFKTAAAGDADAADITAAVAALSFC